MGITKVDDPPSAATAARDDAPLVLASTAEQRQRNRAAVQWLESWRNQPPVEGEMSWEELENLLKENALSPLGPAND